MGKSRGHFGHLNLATLGFCRTGGDRGETEEMAEILCDVSIGILSASMFSAVLSGFAVGAGEWSNFGEDVGVVASDDELADD